MSNKFTTERRSAVSLSLSFLLSFSLTAVNLSVFAEPAKAQVAFGVSVGLDLLQWAASRRARRQSCGGDSNGVGRRANTNYDPSTGSYSASGDDNQDDRQDEGTTGGASRTHSASHSDSYRDKNHAISAYNRGVGYLRDNENSRAIKYFNEALSYDQSMVDAHWGMAIAYKNMRAWANCMAELEIVLPGRSRNDAQSLFLAGEAAQHLHRFAEARKYYKRYLASESSGVNAEIARKAVEIIDHTILGNVDGDYFGDATASRLARWDESRMPLKVFIATNDDVKGYKPEFKTALEHSFQEWSEASAGKVKFEFVSNPAEAQITCSWTDDQASLGGGRELGITHTQARTDGRITEAKIELFTLHDQTDLTSDEILAKETEVELHEIGHALGLGHSHQAFDIMYFETCPEGLEFPLTARDKNTIVALYSTPLSEDGDEKSLPKTINISSNFPQASSDNFESSAHSR
jgi:predicted Zn-dependent protease